MLQDEEGRADGVYSLSSQGRPLWRLWTSVRISPAASKFPLISAIQKQQQTTTTTTTKTLAWLSKQTPTQKQTPRPEMRLGCMYTCQVYKCARVSFRLYRKETSLGDHGECLTTSQLSEDRAEAGATAPASPDPRGRALSLSLHLCSCSAAGRSCGRNHRTQEP